MKLEGGEIKDFCTPKMSPPEYPYGLRVTLEDKELKKLGFLNPPKIDQDFLLSAKCCVVSINKSEGEKLCVSLQIEEMELKSAKEESDDSMEKVLYK